MFNIQDPKQPACSQGQLTSSDWLTTWARLYCVPWSHQGAWKPTQVSRLLFLPHHWFLLCFTPFCSQLWSLLLLDKRGFSWPAWLGSFLNWKGIRREWLAGWGGTSLLHSGARQHSGSFWCLFEISMCTNYSCYLIKLHSSWGWMWLYTDPEASAVPAERILHCVCDNVHPGRRACGHGTGSEDGCYLIKIHPVCFHN